MSFEQNVTPQWIESHYRLWREDPERVSAEWRAFFLGYELAPVAATPPAVDALKQSAVQSLLYRYRSIGHLLACTDPLTPCPTEHPLLTLAAFGLEAADLDRIFHTRRFMKESATLREIVAAMRETYCRSVGIEFMYIQDPAERQWLIDRMEPVRNRPELSREEKIRILTKLHEAWQFESFLHRKFLGQKRFSLEGGEVVISLLDYLVRQAARQGATDIVMGMSHRGRLNVLANIFGKPLENIFADFEDNLEFGFVGEGDVKYHKGFSTDRELPGGTRVHLTMSSNPSHLEAVDPVVEGKCRRRQEEIGAGGVRRVLPVLIHGDAAFAGQGMVAETLNLSELEGFGTGGTFHLVINNQIGFTTLPADARSTLYATDVAKMLSIPIFHVHGEEPEAVMQAVGLALEYRQTFARDVVVEVICYRRQGHNEGDEPYFTQPLMYRMIKDRPPVYKIYAERLQEEGVPPAEIEAAMAEYGRRLQKAVGREKALVDIVGFREKWHGIERQWRPVAIDTGVAPEALRTLADRINSVPAEFHLHPKIARFLERRREAVRKGEGIDWSGAEALAFASLLAEGTPVRLCGQDSRRGTFTQRHAVVFDVETGESRVPLAGVAEKGAAFSVYDSTLSEAAVLGFEYGYSLESPHSLVIWEAQFGDFVNGAQVIIDQFIVSSETKWDRVSGLVLFLPHGFEGQGPEHSSGRIERFLQLAAGDNIQVAYPSIPAQLFHLLRRQVRQPFRKPLIVFTPKVLLRHPRCLSPLSDFAPGEGFREILPPPVAPEEVRSVLVCTGKIYYELLEKMETQGTPAIALVRIEQLYPLRTDLLTAALAPHRGAARFAWVQEEPRNAGAWAFVREPLREVFGREPEYIGRDEAASPAVGSHRLHQREQEEILEQAMKAKG